MEKERLNQLKEKHGQNALFLFRAGDFYELYYDDAETVSKLLGITLTRRFDGTPQAMFPHYALDTTCRRWCVQDIAWLSATS